MCCNSKLHWCVLKILLARLKNMSRNSAPSTRQIEKLVNFLEEKPWLAKGYARTANARIRSRKAWAEIATALNCDGSGCVKNADQWCKYWKDKKGAVKRKSGVIAAARRRTGGGNEDVPELSEAEQKILMIMGGESFATGDQQFEINPFPESQAAELPDNSSGQSESILREYVENLNQEGPGGTSTVPEQPLPWDESAMAVMGSSNDVREIPASAASSMSHEVLLEFPVPTNRPSEEHTISIVNERDEPSIQLEYNIHEGSESSPRRESRGVPRRRLHESPRGSAARRRLLQRSPPAQRRSQMVSLTDRFIAIEERRAEAELTTARALQSVARSVASLASSLNSLVTHLSRDRNTD